MSTKKSLKQKCGSSHKKITPKKEKLKPRNDVLVLPPDLLEKLGINLENIKSPQQSSEKNADVCSNLEQFHTMPEPPELCPGKTYSHNEENNSSILETANLMKASVFLSPTFSSMKPNLLLDTNETCIEEIIAKSADNVEDVGQNELFNYTDELKADILKTSNIHTNNDSGYKYELKSNNMQLTDKGMDSVELVEATGKDMKNKQMVPKQSCTNNKANILSPEKVVFESILKIDSISDFCSERNTVKINETHNISKLSDAKNELIHIGEMVLDNNLKQNFLHNENENLSKNKKVKSKSPIIDAESDDENGSQEYPKLQSITNGNVSFPATLEEYKLSAMSEIQNDTYDSYEELNEAGHANYNSENSIVLNNISSVNNLDNSDLSKDKGQDKQKSINNTNTTSNSKLCIQGVEKPGGETHKSINLNGDIKTYSKLKTSKLSNIACGISYLEYNVNNDIDYKMNDKNINDGNNTLCNFCLCEDFGTLNSYDNDDVDYYEHIHFWERLENQCSIDTLLSIYDDNVEHTYKKVSSKVEEIDEKCELNRPHDPVMGICWSYIGNICEQINQEILEELQMNNNVDNKKQCHDDENMLKNSKRKRSDKTSESESDNEKSKAKKANIAVKCGVCKCKISANDWDNHLSEEHCFIAWSEGQEFDWENKDLFTKLNERLKSTDKLTCTFCKSSLLDVKKFIDHVWKCKEQKYPGKNTIVTECPVVGVELENTPKTEVPTLQSDKKPVRNSKKRKRIKQNNEKHVAVDKSLAPESELQNKKNKNKIFKEKEQDTETQKHVSNTPLLDMKTRQINISQEILGSKTELNQITEVSTLAVLRKNKDKNKKQELPLVQSHTVKKRAPETKTEKKRNIEEEIQLETAPQVSTVVKHESNLSVAEVENEFQKVTCGVCKEIVCESSWVQHITDKHDYLAWKDGEPPLDYENENEVRNHLNFIIKEVGELVCKGCGTKRKFAKSYQKHIKNCESMEDLADDQPLVVRTEKVTKVKKEKNKQEKIEDLVKCGVCKLEMKEIDWSTHIFKEHDYIAWKEGEPEIDVNNSQQVYDHLFSIKPLSGLICGKCGSNRRYVKSYLKHIETCSGSSEVLETSCDDNAVDSLILNLSNGEDAKCGVCKMDVEGKNWFNHVHLSHAYLAWKEGKRPLDVSNEEEVYNYLYIISKQYNGLTCNKCGLNRKYVKAYLTHLEDCNSELFESSMIVDRGSDKDSYECAICAEKVDVNNWNRHAMKVHYNLAWFVGDYPIDVKKPSVIEKQLKALKKEYGKLKCNNCGDTRASPMGFFAHIIQCGKTEEETDEYKTYCELCNNKYLTIYKSQHTIMHNRELVSKERRLKQETEEKESVDSPKTEQLSERRRAAEKARQFIEKSEKFEYNCPKCGYGADDQPELDEHKCSKVKYKEYVDSEDSADMSSSDESLDSFVDSNLSDEEGYSDRVRRRHDVSSALATKVTRIPFTVKCAKSFVKQSADDYCKTFLTSETLYPQWRSCPVELIAANKSDTYMPPLKESCQVILHRSDPVTYTLFEAKRHKGCSVFVGGCIQCISWAPPHVDDSEDDFGHFLAVALHNDVDIPRFDFTKAYEHSGLLQIWDFGNLSTMLPEFALGIAHDYGTVWAIDWCPSGARDNLVTPDLDDKPESPAETFLRLGLLAIACSNGSAYILSVPYPSSIKTSESSIYRLTPVAELRLTRGKRDNVQATSISWSVKKGHEIVVVGYSDGTVASYNLACDSPLLTETEDGVNIFYPFQDDRPHSSSITDVKTFPSVVGAGLVSSVSPTGSEAAQQRGSAGVYRHISSTSAIFAPHWPSVLLSGNELIVNQTVNELDLWGLGRRTGAVQKCCGCRHCGHVATFVPPVMKMLTTHPAYLDFQKEPIAVIDMTPLRQKRSREKIDNLQLKLEPFTYQDVVASYALDFKIMRDLDKKTSRYINRPRTQYPERFPLSDVPSMAFYPSQHHHRKLAVATHAGIIFILSDEIAL
ncbi:uncharacterized protein LOC112058234 [Bicyclus anynana]|uniref:Uncharacterized protein LOC112058234 n=1 Tax=Bicyclus anynana TaxID=110368 RepID=A0A6J1PA84_BICAN|nr:uncharacterized protein LOC112058234 [Bicyclus anynana]